MQVVNKIAKEYREPAFVLTTLILFGAFILLSIGSLVTRTEVAHATDVTFEVKVHTIDAQGNPGPVMIQQGSLSEYTPRLPGKGELPVGLSVDTAVVTYTAGFLVDGQVVQASFKDEAFAESLHSGNRVTLGWNQYGHLKEVRSGVGSVITDLNNVRIVSR